MVKQLTSKAKEAIASARFVSLEAQKTKQVLNQELAKVRMTGAF